MTEAEVVDPTEGAYLDCYGDFDPAYRECTQMCEVAQQCKRHQLAAPKPAPDKPALESPAALPEMDPHDFLMQMLEGRYDVDVQDDKGGAKFIRCRKEGQGKVSIKMTESKRYHMQTKKAKLQLDKLESVRQALDVFKAILVV